MTEKTDNKRVLKVVDRKKFHLPDDAVIFNEESVRQEFHRNLRKWACQQRIGEPFIPLKSDK